MPWGKRQGGPVGPAEAGLVYSLGHIRIRDGVDFTMAGD